MDLLQVMEYDVKRIPKLSDSQKIELLKNLDEVKSKFYNKKNQIRYGAAFCSSILTKVHTINKIVVNSLAATTNKKVTVKY